MITRHHPCIPPGHLCRAKGATQLGTQSPPGSSTAPSPHGKGLLCTTSVAPGERQPTTGMDSWGAATGRRCNPLGHSREVSNFNQFQGSTKFSPQLSCIYWVSPMASYGPRNIFTERKSVPVVHGCKSMCWVCSSPLIAWFSAHDGTSRIGMQYGFCPYPQILFF